MPKKQERKTNNENPSMFFSVLAFAGSCFTGYHTKRFGSLFNSMVPETEQFICFYLEILDLPHEIWDEVDLNINAEKNPDLISPSSRVGFDNEYRI